jgi:hypothetical protein
MLCPPHLHVVHSLAIHPEVGNVKVESSSRKDFPTLSCIAKKLKFRSKINLGGVRFLCLRVPFHKEPGTRLKNLFRVLLMFHFITSHYRFLRNWNPNLTPLIGLIEHSVIQQSSYSAMLNIAQSVPSTEPVPSDFRNSVTMNSHWFPGIPLNSGIQFNTRSSNSGSNRFPEFRTGIAFTY